MNDSNERLQHARRNAGYADATSAAKSFGWTVSTYLSHENGSRGISARIALRYAKAFRVSRAWLLTGEISEALPNMQSGSHRQILNIDRDELRKVAALMLRSQKTGERLALELADILVESFSEPPLAAVENDVVRSFEVKLELLGRRPERLKS